MEYYIYQGDDELYHWGIKGMKWGIRRFQNRDGSLTSAGKKHRAALEGKGGSKSGSKSSGKGGSSKKSPGKTKTKSNVKAAEKTKEQKKPEVETKPKKKSVSEMTDTEVRDRINRMMLEKQYYDTQRSLASVTPVQVSKGKKFMNSLLNDVVAPAAKEAGKKWLTNFMEDKLGLNKKSELQRLEDKWKKMDYKKKISDLEKGIKDNDDPYGLKDIEAQSKKAKAEYETADYKNKQANIGKSSDKDTNWDTKTKEQTFYRDAYRTEKDKLDYQKYLSDRETLGESEAWELYKKRQADK